MFEQELCVILFYCLREGEPTWAMKQAVSECVWFAAFAARHKDFWVEAVQCRYRWDSIYPCLCDESGERVSFISAKYVSPHLSCGFGGVKEGSEEGGGLAWFCFLLQSKVQSSFGNCLVGCIFYELCMVIKQ